MGLLRRYAQQSLAGKSNDDENNPKPLNKMDWENSQGPRPTHLHPVVPNEMDPGPEGAAMVGP